MTTFNGWSFFYKYCMKIDWSKFNPEVQKGVELCSQIEKFGYEAYIVGGCVRDIVLWHKEGEKGDPNVHDVDIATNMPIEELYDNFKCTSNNGEAHGTILVLYKKEAFEVTQFRTDGDYSDGRHPDSVKFTKSFKDDTDRRDFTINAMGIDCRGNLIDYHGGESDLENGILRTVGKASQRFSEDALRIIRALRFASRFGMKIDPDIYEGIEEIKGNLSKIAKERIGAELIKTAEYGAKPFANVIELIAKTQINEVIDPQGAVDWRNGVALTKNRLVKGTQDFAKSVKCAFGCLLYGADLKKAAELFRLENDIVKSIKWCYDNLETYENFGDNLVDTVKMVTNDNFELLDELANIINGEGCGEEELRNIKNLAQKVLPKSKDLSSAVADAGYKGLQFGKVLRELAEWYYDKTMRGNQPTKQQIAEYINRI